MCSYYQIFSFQLDTKVYYIFTISYLFQLNHMVLHTYLVGLIFAGQLFGFSGQLYLLVT